MSKEENVIMSQIRGNDYVRRKDLMMWLIRIAPVLSFLPTTSKSSQQIQAQFILPIANTLAALIWRLQVTYRNMEVSLRLFWSEL